jgi:uncharacterized protein (DUF1800 family)
MNSEVVQQEQAGRGPAAAWSATALAAAALTACGGAGGEPEDKHQPATPESVVVPWPDEAQAARFLGQAALAATPDNIAAVVQKGYAAWIDEQMNLSRGWPDRPRAMDLMVAADKTQYWLSAASMSQDTGLDNVLWYGLFKSNDELRQRVMLALSEIFVVSIRNMPIPYGQVATAAYWDILGDHCFGNFLDLLENVTLSPAMGTFLSMRGSSKADGSGRHPDENFAREVLQLFTIGLVELDAHGEPVRDAQGQVIYTYDSETVTQLARVFTGWDFDEDWVDFVPAMTYHYTTRPLRFVPERFDTGPKWVLKPQNQITAAPGRATVRQALQFIVNHPNVGPFLARQLIQRLVTSNPEREHVARVAAAFNDNGAGVRGDMRAVIKAVLLDPLARLAVLRDADQQARRGRLREPVLRLVQWGRLTNINSNDGFWRAGDLSGSDKLFQAPLRASSVFNFFRPGFMLRHAGPGNESLLAPEFQITDESSVIGYANFLQEILHVGIGYWYPERLSPDYTSWDELAETPARLVDGLNLLLTGRSLSEHTLSVVLAAVKAAQAGYGQTQMRNRVLVAFYLIMCSADYLVQR